MNIVKGGDNADLRVFSSGVLIANPFSIGCDRAELAFTALS